MPRRTGQHLIFDADDTLWENNIYFERAFEEFVAFLAHSALSAVQVRDILDEIEAANAKIHGYGSKNFGNNLNQVYRHLCERDIDDQALTMVMSFAERILDHPMELIAHVPETLAELATRHDLTLFTKGNPDEQRLKVDRSELGGLFSHVEIVKEKNAGSYGALVAARGFNPAITWMIGNSPKSDVNPALEIGLNAVFIPHAHTWILEKQEIRAGSGELLQVDEFSQLLHYF